ncbi:MAG: hypothetical protein HY000_14540 [Planctomycetes bacterium]|nr:hypothetical protein [Planctomycetota bacterium]
MNAVTDSNFRVRRFRFRLRRLHLFVAVACVVLLYVGSYYRLSRRGLAEARELGIDGFLYVPYNEAAKTEDLSRHYLLAMLYAPLNWLDQEVFGCDAPIRCIMWRLSA